MLTTLHATAGEKKQPRVPPTLFQILGPAGLSDLPPPYLWGSLNVLEKQQEPQSQSQAAGSHLQWR